MPISVTLIHPSGATCSSHGSYAGMKGLAFDVLTIHEEGCGDVSLHLPHGTGETVARAIREAIQTRTPQPGFQPVVIVDDFVGDLS